MNILFILLLAPLMSSVISFCFSNKAEKHIYIVTLLGVIVNAVTLTILTVQWANNGFEGIFAQGPVLYHGSQTDFSINLFLDGYGLSYLIIATFLTGIIIVFSRFYIHREKGYKRFFTNLKFFYLGLMIVLLSGNLETLFVGWEILGVTSFFLVGFYRERYLPVKNALKVVSLYRVADIALLLGIWLSHHYFGYSINFNDMDGLHSPHHHIVSETFYQFMIPSVLLLAAMVKSAQFPFSSWLPRAMEGPTTSSAIFYGSLSAHIGLFLLIRTSPFWEGNFIFHFIIGGVGLITAIVSNITASVQSTIKTQIAYSSISQIGLMFIEVALGLYWLAILHFACNALLRTHQLLISPSVLSYKIHDQFFHFNPPAKQGTNGFWNRLKLSLYILSIKEFNLDSFMYSFLWAPLKKAGNSLRFISTSSMYYFMIPIFFMGIAVVINRDELPLYVLKYLPESFGVISLILILKAFVSRRSAMYSWLLIIINQMFQSLAFMLNEKFDYSQVAIYLSGIIVAGMLGIWIIERLKKAGKSISLNQFNGNVYEHPRLAFLFIVACLGLAGFPITPTFIGEDLMLSHIHENQFPLLVLITLNLILDGLVIFRIYSRLFLGQHKSGYHDFAYRSS